MTKAERNGLDNVCEITPHCVACGELLHVPYSIARSLTQHESLNIKCDQCDHVTTLETEIVYFSRAQDAKQEGKADE